MLHNKTNIYQFQVAAQHNGFGHFFTEEDITKLSKDFIYSTAMQSICKSKKVGLLV